MILLIYSLEIILFLLVVSLGYRVFKAYNSEYINSPNEGNELTSQVAISSDLSGDKTDGKSIVEAYIGDFFMAESNEFNNPLSAFKQSDQVDIKASSVEQHNKSKIENADRSISSKVIDAMMAEADLACAS